MPRIRGKYELEDFMRAQKLHNQHNWFLLIALYLSLGMMIVLAAVSLYLAAFGRIDWPKAFFPLVFLAFVAFFRFYILPAQYRRIFQQNEELTLPFDCDLTQQAIIFRNARGTSTLPWMEAVQYRKDKQIFLIYRTSTMFHMLPLRLFDDELKLNFLNDRIRSADIPPASRVISPIQLLLLIVMVIGIIFMITAVLWPWIAS